jgi:exodeoxyribonuclease VII large subunit
VGGRLSLDSILRRLGEHRARLEVSSARLDGASYQRVLARGFVLVRDKAGHAVTTMAAVAPGDRLRLQFQDGELRATADGRQGKLL